MDNSGLLGVLADGVGHNLTNSPTEQSTSDFWDCLYQLHLSGKLCDIQLAIRDVNQHGEVAYTHCLLAHKLVLVGSSRFFRRSLDNGELLDMYNFDGIQPHNFQLLVAYMYHQVSWKDILANDEAAEVARILEVIRHDFPAESPSHQSHDDTPMTSADRDKNNVLLIQMRDKASGSLIQPVSSRPIPTTDGREPKPNRVIIRDLQKELERHNITGRSKNRKVVVLQKEHSPVDYLPNSSIDIETESNSRFFDHEGSPRIITSLVNSSIQNALPTISLAQMVDSGITACSLDSSDAIKKELTPENLEEAPESIPSGNVCINAEDDNPAFKKEFPASIQPHGELQTEKSSEGEAELFVKASNIPVTDINVVSTKPEHKCVTDSSKEETSEKYTKTSSQELEHFEDITGSSIPTPQKMSYLDNQVKQSVTKNHSQKREATPTGDVKEENMMQDSESQLDNSERSKRRKIDEVLEHEFQTQVVHESTESTEKQGIAGDQCDDEQQKGIVLMESASNSDLLHAKLSDGKVVKVISSSMFQKDDEGNVKHAELPNGQTVKFIPASMLNPDSKQRIIILKPGSLKGTNKLTSKGLKPAVLVPSKKFADKPEILTTSALRQKARDIQAKGDPNHPHKCCFCDKTFKNNTGLRIHEQWKHGATDQLGQPTAPQKQGQQVHNCTVCEKVMGSYQALGLHMKTVHNRPLTHKCEECGLEFRQSRDYRGHLIKQHGAQLYKCLQCGTSFKSPEGYKIHMFKQHAEAENNFVCNICSKRFKMKHELKSHQRITHAPERAFKCRLCTRDFKCKAALKRHLVTFHTDVRSHVCPVCSLMFKSLPDMKAHKKKHFRDVNPIKVDETNVEQSDVKCRKCRKIFKRPYQRVDHERLVHGQRDDGIVYMCTMCKKSYSTRAYLLQHIRSVHLARQHKCEHCLYEFPHAYLLRKHRSKCKGYPIISKPYRCFKCNLYFNLKGNLTRHMKTPGRCRGYSRNFANYIMVVSGEGTQADQTNGHQVSNPVSIEALQASEALQQLQASGGINHGEHVVEIEPPSDVDLETQVIQQGLPVYNQSGEVILNQEQVEILHHDSAQEDGVLQDTLKNMISMSHGNMNVTNDQQGNMVIEVSQDGERNLVISSNQDAQGMNQIISLQQENIEQNISLQQENIEPNISQPNQVQYIQTSDGQIIVQNSTEEFGGEYIENVEYMGNDSIYQITEDGTLQLVQGTQQSDYQVMQKGGSLKVIQTVDGIQVIESNADEAAILQETDDTSSRLIVKEEILEEMA